MGVLNHLVVADASEAEAVGASTDPSQNWDGFFCRGLNHIKLAVLWALVEAGSPDDKLEQRLDEIRTIPEGNQGPWVDIVPRKMLSSLASIAGMDEGEQESLAQRLWQSGEFQGWEESEVVHLVLSVGDMAENARLENKTLLIWTSL